jgi:hypothetical protein
MERSVNSSRFGKKLKLPSTVQLKHQLLLRWLDDQKKKEAAELDGKNTASEAKHLKNLISDSF